MNDLISRQAAVDGVKTLHEVAWKNWHDPTLSANVVIDMIKDLPSAQPELNEWCPDCKEYDSKRHYCPRFNRVIREALKDVQSKIIYCKDCVKHNIGVNDTPYKSYVCPLVKFRGKAQGHEFDYQYCVYGVKKDERLN